MTVTTSALSSAEIGRKIADLEEDLKSARAALPLAQISASRAFLGEGGNPEAAEEAHALAHRVSDLLAGMRALYAHRLHDELSVEITRRKGELKRAEAEAHERRHALAKLEHERKTSGASPQPEYLQEHAILAARTAVFEADSRVDQIERGIEDLRSRCEGLENEFPSAFSES